MQTTLAQLRGTQSVVFDFTGVAEPDISVPMGSGESLHLAHPIVIPAVIHHGLGLATRLGPLLVIRQRSG